MHSTYSRTFAAPFSASASNKATSVNQKLKELSTCTICHKKYNSTNRAPMAVPCGHTFCKACVDKLVTEKTILCRKCHRVSLIGFGGLSKNVVFLQYLEKLNLLAKDGNIPRKQEVPNGTVPIETYKAIKLGPFDRQCQFFMKLVEGYMDYQLDAPCMIEHVELMVDVRDTIRQVEDARVQLQAGLSALRNIRTV